MPIEWRSERAFGRVGEKVRAVGSTEPKTVCRCSGKDQSALRRRSTNGRSRPPDGEKRSARQLSELRKCAWFRDQQSREKLVAIASWKISTIMPALAKPQHEAFAQFVVAGLTPAKAYEAAGFSKKGARQGAARLLTNATVRARVRELTAECLDVKVKRLILDRNRTLNRLDEVIDHAFKAKNYHAVIKGIELLGRELGLFIKRSTKFPWDGNFSKLTDDQLKRVIGQLEAAMPDASRPSSRVPSARRSNLVAPTWES